METPDDRARRRGRGGPAGKDRDPQILLDRGAQRVRAPAFEGPSRPDAPARQGALDRLAVRAALLRHDERLSLELLCEKRPRARQAVASRHEQGHLLREERLEAKTELERRRGAETDVEVAVGDAAAHAPGPGDVEPYAQGGPRLSQTPQKRRDPLARRGLDRSDSQQPAPAVAQLRHAPRKGIDGFEYGKGPLGEELARRRPRTAAARPVEELEPELRLELLDVERHGRLREAESARGLQKAALAQHRAERQKVPELHWVTSVILMIESYKFIIDNTSYLADAPGSRGQRHALEPFPRGAPRPAGDRSPPGLRRRRHRHTRPGDRRQHGDLHRRPRRAPARRSPTRTPSGSSRSTPSSRAATSSLSRSPTSSTSPSPTGASRPGRLRRLEREPHRCRRAGIALPAQWVSRGFFEQLGCAPRSAARRGPKRRSPGPARVVLLGDGLWRSRFGADPSILGKVVTLSGEPYEVIGVLPPDFLFLTATLRSSSARSSSRPTRGAPGASAAFMRVVGPAAPGRRAPEAAKQDLDAIVGRLRAAYPDTNAGRSGVRLQPLGELVVGNYRADAPGPPGGRRSRSS